MDKAIIIGTYEFIGFHLTLSLLEQGVETIGVNIQSICDESYEEKKLLVGRNSNFYEKDASCLNSIESLLGDQVYVFIDFYSFYMKRKEIEFTSILEKATFIEKSSNSVIFYPIDFYIEKNPTNILDADRSLFFYLPTIYGPWQPSVFLFQQLIMNKQNTVPQDSREWTGDALYIEDIMNEILLNYKNKGSYILKSNTEEHWKKAASMLLGENAEFERCKQCQPLSEEIKEIIINSSNIKEGIENQKNHFKMRKELL